MMNSESAPPQPALPLHEEPIRRRWLPWILTRTPLVTLAIYCTLSVLIRENFPFSHFPMYSNPTAERIYYTISGPDGKGLPIQTLTGTTDPKIGKIFRTEAEELRKKEHLKHDLTDEQVEGIGKKMIAYFRQEAKNRGQNLPEKIQINRIYIGYENGQITENPIVIARE